MSNKASLMSYRQQELKRQRTIHYTFRLAEDIFFNIQKEAESKGMSTSALINQILSQYINVDRYFDQLGYIPTSKDTLRLLVNGADKESLIRDSRALGSLTAKESIPFVYNEMNGYTLLKFLDLWGKSFDCYRHETSGHVHKFAINHSVSIQFSIYLRELLDSLVEPIIPRRMQFFDITPNIVNFSFEV